MTRCPVCKKENTFKPWEGTVSRLGIEIRTHGERCASCGETIFDLEQARQQSRALAVGLAARGVRKPNEFKLVRKAAGLRANELAELLGVRPETVSRWERGEVEIPRTVAFALGELLLHPKLARAKLEAFARCAPIPQASDAPDQE